MALTASALQHTPPLRIGRMQLVRGSISLQVLKAAHPAPPRLYVAQLYISDFAPLPGHGLLWFAKEECFLFFGLLRRFRSFEPAQTERCGESRPCRSVPRPTYLDRKSTS